MKENKWTRGGGTKKPFRLTLAAAKIFFTEAEISGPIPSPGIIVTVLVSGARTEADALSARRAWAGCEKNGWVERVSKKKE